MRAFVAIVLLGASSIWGTFTANAQTSIETAEALYERGALTDALRAFEEALDEGPHSTASLASIYWHLGTLKMSAGEREEASTYFARALALDPRARVPEELPPEPQAIFRSLQEVAHRMAIALDAGEVSVEATHIEVDVLHAPEGFAASYRVSAAPDGAAPWRTDGPVTGSVVIPSAAWRGARNLSVEVQVLDAHENVLASATTELHAPVVVSEPTPSRAPIAALNAPGPREERSLARNPWLWTGVGAVVLGSVLTAVLLSQRQERFEGSAVAVTRDPR